jgi:cation transport ATPase
MIGGAPGTRRRLIFTLVIFYLVAAAVAVRSFLAGDPRWNVITTLLLSLAVVTAGMFFFSRNPRGARRLRRWNSASLIVTYSLGLLFAIVWSIASFEWWKPLLAIIPAFFLWRQIKTYRANREDPR